MIPFLGIVVRLIPLLLTIHHQQFKLNVLDAKRQPIYAHVIIVKNHYVLSVEQSIINHKKVMLITHFIV